MKTIAVLIGLVMLIGSAVAFPDMPWGDNPEVCKVQINTGASTTLLFTWFNNATNEWEVRLGAENWKKSVIYPITYRGDEKGMVEVDLSKI